MIYHGNCRVDDSYPFAVPVNYYDDEQNEKIYFHGARSGHKVDSLNKRLIRALKLYSYMR